MFTESQGAKVIQKTNLCLVFLTWGGCVSISAVERPWVRARGRWTASRTARTGVLWFPWVGETLPVPTPGLLPAAPSHPEGS